MVVLLVAVSLVTAAGPAEAKPKLKLTSPAFENGGTIPDGFTCDGANATPPLVWKGLPKGVVELAITLEDPDAPAGTFVHWVAWGIDPDDGEVAEATLPADIVQGLNGAGRPIYLGPCPPPGPQHRYRFTLYALDEPVTIGPGSTIDDLRAAIKGTVKAKAKLVGLYAPDASLT